MAIKSLSIRIDTEMLDKLHVVADYEGRSANSQILILIRDCIEKYEERISRLLTDDNIVIRRRQRCGTMCKYLRLKYSYLCRYYEFIFLAIALHLW